MPKKKWPIAFVGDLTDDWEQRLAFVDGEFVAEEDDEDEIEADQVEEIPELKRAERRRPAKRKATRPKVDGATLEQKRAQQEVTRELNKLVDASILKALPQIAVKLSLQARAEMKRAAKFSSPYDIAMVAEYLRQTSSTFERVGRERDSAHFRVLLIDWLTENGATQAELKEALGLVASTRAMLTSGKDSANLVKLDQLKIEIRRRLSELQRSKR